MPTVYFPCTASLFFATWHKNRDGVKKEKVWIRSSAADTGFETIVAEFRYFPRNMEPHATIHCLLSRTDG